MNIALGADHAGFPLKAAIAQHIRESGNDVVDIGAHELQPDDDYPDFALAVAQAILLGDAERGIILCGSGVGASIAANKVAGIRAAVCHDAYSARQGVEHDDMNVITLGSRIVGVSLARVIVTAYLGAAFTGEERHTRRLSKVSAIERRSLSGARNKDAEGE